MKVKTKEKKVKVNLIDIMEKQKYWMKSKVKIDKQEKGESENSEHWI